MLSRQTRPTSSSAFRFLLATGMYVHLQAQRGARALAKRFDAVVRLSTSNKRPVLRFGIAQETQGGNHRVRDLGAGRGPHHFDC